jgi:hypothetical protein
MNCFTCKRKLSKCAKMLLCQQCRLDLVSKLRLNPETSPFMCSAQGDVLLAEALKLIFTVKAGKNPPVQAPIT